MKRVLTALVLIPIVVGAVVWGPNLALRALACVAALLALREFLGLSRKFGADPFLLPAYAAGAALILFPGLPHLVFLALFGALVYILVMVRGVDLITGYHSAVATVFGVLYTCAPFALGGDLHQLNPHWLLLALVVNWVGDSAALYVGRAFGKHKAAPRISPGKSWEGCVASAAMAAIVAATYFPVTGVAGPGIVFALLFGLVVNIAAQFGDLAESAIKRAAGVKDSGTLLPGHGGMLDRIDGLLFSLPVAHALVSVLLPAMPQLAYL